MAKKDTLISANPQSKMAQLLAETNFAPRVLSRGESLEGKVVAILADSVLLDIGAKAEGLLPLKELQDLGEEVKVGDLVPVVVAQPEGDSGVAILTVRRSVREKVWEELQEASNSGETLEVKGLEANRGGLLVDYKGVRGFIPASHLSTSPKAAFGKGLLVKVLEANQNLNKLVFSEKEALAEELPKLELPFKVGDTLEVNVTKILPFGLLVGLPQDLTGLIHISEISWRKVEDLSKLYKVGESLKAKVISIDPASRRVNLSIKQLEKDPWKEAAKKYKVGKVFTGKISRLTSYGAFVEIEEGIEGLLHSSKIPYGRSLTVGEKIKVSVDLFDSDQKKVALRLAEEEKLADSRAKEPSKAKARQVKKADKES